MHTFKINLKGKILMKLIPQMRFYTYSIFVLHTTELMYLIILQTIGNYTYILLYVMFSLIYDFMYFKNVVVYY